MKTFAKRIYRFLVLVAGESAVAVLLPMVATVASLMVFWLLLRLIGFSLHYYFGYSMPVHEGSENPAALGMMAVSAALLFGMALYGVWVLIGWLLDKWHEAGRHEE
jgi:hypothetical protein